MDPTITPTKTGHATWLFPHPHAHAGRLSGVVRRLSPYKWVATSERFPKVEGFGSTRGEAIHDHAFKATNEAWC